MRLPNKVNDPKRDVVYLITRHGILTLDSDSNTGIGMRFDGMPDSIVEGVMGSCKCNKCGAVNVVVSLDGGEVVGAEEREMGADYELVSEVWNECSKCKNELHVKYSFGVYAYSWHYIEAEETEGCSICYAGDLRSAAEEISRLVAKTRPETYDSDEELFLNPENKELVRVLVEGRDDVLVLNELLSKCQLQPRADFLLRTGMHEGIDSVCSAISFLKGMKIGVPLVVVVDSDGQEAERKRTLANAGARDDEQFVWKQKELEVYLEDPAALALVLAAPEGDIRRFVRETGLHGKALLDSLFKEYNMSPPKAETKQIIARQMKIVPKDIAALAAVISSKVAEGNET